MRVQTVTCSTTIVLGLLAGVHAASGDGKSTRYWDCCKPSCSWSGKAKVDQPVLTCDTDDNFITDFQAKSGCLEGGTAYTCTNNSPWAENDALAYGFAATAITGGDEASWCCGCYAIVFTSGKAIGKTMVVQSTNTGGDLGENHFDILMPGGGLGMFDGCTSQFGGMPGTQYGGIAEREECELMPEGLRDGCYWRFDWFNNADNPELTFHQIKCPEALIERTGCTREDDGDFPEFVPPEPTWEAPTPTETAGKWEKCDSLLWGVAKLCPEGFYCHLITDYHWQCDQIDDPNDKRKREVYFDA